MTLWVICSLFRIFLRWLREPQPPSRASATVESLSHRREPQPPSRASATVESLSQRFGFSPRWLRFLSLRWLRFSKPPVITSTAGFFDSMTAFSGRPARFILSLAFLSVAEVLVSPVAERSRSHRCCADERLRNRKPPGSRPAIRRSDAQ